MSTQRLLPRSGGSPSHASYSISLNSALRGLLSRNEGRIKLVVAKGEVSLKVDGTVYKLELNNTNSLDIYQQLTKTSFKNIGQVHQRLEITSPISSPNVSPMEEEEKLKRKSPTYTHKSKTPQPLVANDAKLNIKARKLVQLLATGPLSQREITEHSQLSAQEVDSALELVSMVYDENANVIKDYPHPRQSEGSKDTLFILDYSNYKDVKLIDSKLPRRDLDMIKKNCQLAYDHLKYPETHPAREYLARALKASLPIKQLERSSLASKSASVTPKMPSSSSSSQPTPKPVQKSSGKAKQTPVNLPPIPKQKKVANDDPKPRTTSLDLEKKRKREDNDDTYYLELAQRFQKKYKEYEELYKTIQVSKAKDTEGLKKLYDLHKSLESWKKQLWNSVSATK